MQIKLFDRNGGAGAAEVKESALFYHFTIQLDHKTETPVRVYAVAGLTSVYLGIPDRAGRLTAQLARKHLPSAPTCAAEDGCRMAMPEETAARFPAWTASFEPVVLDGKQYYELFFDADGRPRLREAPPEAETSASTNDETDDTAEESPEVDAPAGTAEAEAAQ